MKPLLQTRGCSAAGVGVARQNSPNSHDLERSEEAVVLVQSLVYTEGKDL
jgi:hypothetical protein